MLLHLLADDLRGTFIELATYVSLIDNNFAESEQLVISQFRKEMNLPETDYQVANLEFDVILSRLSAIDNQYKKIIILEILAIVWADGSFNEAEKKVFKSLCNKLEISSKTIKLMKSWVKSLNSIYSEIDNFLMEG